MAEDGEDDGEPAITLGDDAPVAGAPIARVASRISWPSGKSNIVENEGQTTIRTSEGPRELSKILRDVELSYFARRQEFISEVRAVIGYGPVPPAEDIEEE